MKLIENIRVNYKLLKIILQMCFYFFRFQKRWANFEGCILSSSIKFD